MAEIKNLEFVEGTTVSAPTTAIVEVGTPDGGSSFQAVNINYLTTIGAGLKTNATGSDPTATDDAAAGYSINSIWTNTTSDENFWASDVTNTAAVWRKIVNGNAAQTIAGVKTFSSNVIVSDSTSSTDKDTGSIVTEGGVGIEENLNVGGDATIVGNLTVQGTTTQVDTTNLNVKDANILINDGGNDASSEGSGIQVERTGTDGSLVYEDALASKFKVGALAGESEIMTVGTAQTVSGAKTYTAINDHENAVNMKQVTTPANPAAGDNRLYFKNDDSLYKLNSAGQEVEVGSGGGGGSLDIFYQESFEVITDADWSTGDNAIFLTSPTAGNGGTTGTTDVSNISSPLNGTGDLIYTQASGSVDDYIASPEVTIYEKHQQKHMGLIVNYTYDGDDNDINILIYDETNNVILQEVGLESAPASTRFSMNTFIPNGVISIRWGIQTKVENIGAILHLDDAEMTINPFVISNFDNMSDWESYSLTITGTGSNPTKTGSPITDEARWRRVGDSMEIQYNYVQTAAGTAGTGSYLFSLPTGYLIDTAKQSVAGNNATATDLVGNVAVGLNVSNGQFIGFVQAADTSNLSLVVLDDANAPLYVGSSRIPLSGEAFYTFRALVPIANWSSSSENIVTPTRIAQPGRLHTSSTTAVSTSTETFIGFSTSDFDDDSLFTNVGSASNTTYTSTTYYTAPRNGKYRINSQLWFADLDIDVDELLAIRIAVNGTSVRFADYRVEGTAASPRAYRQIDDIILLSKDDDVSIVVYHECIGDVSPNDTTNYSWFTVEQVDTIPVLGALPIPLIGYVRDVQASGTNGGTPTAASWNTRVLNTSEADFSKFGTLSANQVTLIAGKYKISANAPSLQPNAHKLRLRNITDSSTDIDGGNSSSSSSDTTNTRAHLMGQIIITATKTFELQHYITNSAGPAGLGSRLNVGGIDEIYAQMEITKLI